MNKQILVVDDDPHIREVVVFALEKAGMQPLQAADGCEALRIAQKNCPDLIVLDIGLPEMDGLEVCRTLRKTSNTPILFLSSRDEEIDKSIGLEIGGDDYMTKPFSPRELIARINVILRRGAALPLSENQSVTKGSVTLNPLNYTAQCNGNTVPLTATEYELLAALFRRPEKVFTRDALMDQAYGPALTVSDRTVDSHIRRIRSKFTALMEAEVISTVHGIGYKLGPCC